MPPKAKQPNTSKKAEQKKKEKVIEDKTFGLKNKKGAKQQKFIQQVQKQVKSGGVPPRKQGADDNTKKKEEKIKDAKELNMIFKPVQKVEKGADPKSILCSFFKVGQCTKGSKCKFSHDLTIERKAEKRSMYYDMRDDGDEEETMENWSEDKLKEVVEKKHGEAEKKKPTTDIICKYFVEAVEKSKYGWFWNCPNGPDCIYRHALPPGFVLEKDRKKEKKDDMSLEDVLENKRQMVAGNSTKLTLQTFLEWKKKKIKEKQEAERKAQEKKRNDFKAGHHIGLSGRDMFSFNPELANDTYEEGDVGIESYARNEEDEDNIEYHELDVNALSNYGFTDDQSANPDDVAVGAVNEDLFIEEADDNISDDNESDDTTLSEKIKNCIVENGT